VNPVPAQFRDDLLDMLSEHGGELQIAFDSESGKARHRPFGSMSIFVLGLSVLLAARAIDVLATALVGVMQRSKSQRALARIAKDANRLYERIVADRTQRTSATDLDVLIHEIGSFHLTNNDSRFRADQVHGALESTAAEVALLLGRAGVSDATSNKIARLVAARSYSLFVETMRQGRQELWSGADYLIVTALTEEWESVRRVLGAVEDTPPDAGLVGRYAIATIDARLGPDWSCTYRIAITQLDGMGRTRAAARAAEAIARVQPANVVLTGIAGGVSNNGVCLGDVLLADQIVDYELQKLTDAKVAFRWDVYKADPRLIAAARALRERGWQRTEGRPDAGLASCHFGPVASGDKVIATSAGMARLLEHWPALLGVEMEAGGVCAAIQASGHRPGFLMVRGVSDHADAAKDSAKVGLWRKYASDISASYLGALLRNGPTLPLSGIERR
jgi:nucleoside phosphorylase